MDPARARKLGERIAQIVAEMLERRIKDPRLGFVTVTEARVTGDLREATVFYTVYGSDEERGRHGRRAGQRDRADPVRGRPPDRDQAHPVDLLRAGHRAGRGQRPSRSWWPGRASPTPRSRPPGRAPCPRATPTRTGSGPGRRGRRDRRARRRDWRGGERHPAAAGDAAGYSGRDRRHAADRAQWPPPRPDRHRGRLGAGRQDHRGGQRDLPGLPRPAGRATRSARCSPWRRRCARPAGRAGSSRPSATEPFEMPAHPAVPARHRPAPPARAGTRAARGDDHLRRGQPGPARPAEPQRRAGRRADRARPSRVQHRVRHGQPGRPGRRGDRGARLRADRPARRRADRTSRSACTPGWSPTPARSSTPTTSPRVHQLAARLLADRDRARRRSRASCGTAAVRLPGAAVGGAGPGRCSSRGAPAGRGLVWTTVTRADRAAGRAAVRGGRVGHRRGAARPTRPTWRSVLKEDDDGRWQVSARSKGTADVGRACVALGGGGHALAAGLHRVRHRGRGHGRAAQGHSRRPASGRPGGDRARDSGLVIVDKPRGLTSHDVVARIRRLAGTRRVGHAGTLDPMATGVLVVGVEKATRLLGHLALTEKEYTGHDPARPGDRHRRRRGRGHRAGARPPGSPARRAAAGRGRADRRDRAGPARLQRDQGGRASAPTGWPARAPRRSSTAADRHRLVVHRRRRCAATAACWTPTSR